MDQDFFALLVRELLEAGIAGINIISERGRPLDDWYSLYNSDPRITICCKGTRHYAITRGETLEELTQGARQGIYTAPGCWQRMRAIEPYEALSVVFYDDSLHFTFARFDGSDAAKIDFPMRTIVTRLSLPTSLDESGRDFCRALLRPNVAPAVYSRSLVELLLCKALERLEGEATPQSKAQFSWQTATHFIEENCPRPLTRDDVARFLKMHPNHISRLFARCGGETFASHLLRVRLERARKLLQDPALNVSEVARLSGFVNANYFIRTFKARYGTTPGRARPTE